MVIRAFSKSIVRNDFLNLLKAQTDREYQATLRSRDCRLLVSEFLLFRLSADARNDRPMAAVDRGAPLQLFTD